jgi:hypothetical protein
MKKALITIYTMALLTNCQQKTTETTTTADTTAMAGNDLDSHGCKGSAGYQWSVLKNECVRIFEVGVRLDAVDSTLDKTFSAFAVFADETKEEASDVEIFIPALKDSYTLTQWKGMYSLEEGKKTLYQGMRR